VGGLLRPAERSRSVAAFTPPASPEKPSQYVPSPLHKCTLSTKPRRRFQPAQRHEPLHPLAQSCLHYRAPLHVRPLAAPRLACLSSQPLHPHLLCQLSWGGAAAPPFCMCIRFLLPFPACTWPLPRCTTLPHRGPALMCPLSPFCSAFISFCVQHALSLGTLHAGPGPGAYCAPSAATACSAARA
jgi:hypothetical protein